jgi:hypothetical protein
MIELVLPRLLSLAGGERLDSSAILGIVRRG